MYRVCLKDKYYATVTNSYLHAKLRVTYICVDKLTIIGSDNGLLPGMQEAIIWTIAKILLIRPLGKKVKS